MKSEISPVKSSRFSDFIRNASFEEKSQVYLHVIERACARQWETLLQAARSVRQSPAFGVTPPALGSDKE